MFLMFWSNSCYSHRHSKSNLFLILFIFCFILLLDMISRQLFLRASAAAAVPGRRHTKLVTAILPSSSSDCCSLSYRPVGRGASVASPHSRSFPSPLTAWQARYTRAMTTAYNGEPGDGMTGLCKLAWLPYRSRLESGCEVEVAPFRESEWDDGMTMMNLIIREGKSWPFEEEFETVDAYRGYFLSHAAFVVRTVHEGDDANGCRSGQGSVIGAFYIKPNYPGRCSHICNGGFVTHPNYRRMGVAKLMGRIFLRAARDLGYRSSYFNLVFKSNSASVALWESLGFERVAVLENAARLEGVVGLDTAYGYRYDLETLSEEF